MPGLRLGILISGKGYQSKPDYCFLDFVNHFKKRETAKLTLAPTTAKIIVFAISSERILGKILNTVPEAVPVFKVILVSITGFVVVFIFGNLH